MMFFFSQSENFVSKIFEHLGIRYINNVEASKDSFYDYLINDKEEARIPVEVKSYKSYIDVPDAQIQLVAEKLKKYSVLDIDQNISIYSMLIVFNKVSYKTKREMRKQNILLLDISNILYLIKDEERLIKELKEFLPYSIIDVIPEGINLKKYINMSSSISRFDSTSEEYELIRRIETLQSGNLTSQEFEQIGEDIVKLIFGDYLYGWKTQPTAANGMYRFDLIAKIKNQTGFWGMLYNFFKSRYVIFEFKNYSNEITQAQIYTTEKYLYKTALRNIAIILTRKGFDDNAYKACAGSLREQGKLILVLNQEDLINLLELKKKKSDEDLCSGYLEDVFDKFLMDLEK
jgi:hypothetical protein